MPGRVATEGSRTAASARRPTASAGPAAAAPAGEARALAPRGDGAGVQRHLRVRQPHAPGPAGPRGDRGRLQVRDRSGAWVPAVVRGGPVGDGMRGDASGGGAAGAGGITILISGARAALGCPTRLPGAGRQWPASAHRRRRPRKAAPPLAWSRRLSAPHAAFPPLPTDLHPVLQPAVPQHHGSAAPGAPRCAVPRCAALRCAALRNVVPGRAREGCRRAAAQGRRLAVPWPAVAVWQHGAAAGAPGRLPLTPRARPALPCPALPCPALG